MPMVEKELGQTQRQIYERLAQLDEETQERISQKYYHGTRPWLPDSRTRRKNRRKSGKPLAAFYGCNAHPAGFFFFD
jgi:hypothetical protein